MRRVLFVAAALVVVAGCSARPVGGPDGWKVYGPSGSQGVAGPAGPAGAAGPQGIAGAPGQMGPQGQAGAVGAVGPKGAEFVWTAFSDVSVRSQPQPRSAKARRGKIADLASVLKSRPGYKVELEAYTDPRGTNRHNLALSRRRVDAVRSALVAAGVPADAIEFGAYGQMTPKCAAKTEEWLAARRRVEVKVIPAAGRRRPSASPQLGQAK